MTRACIHEVRVSRLRVDQGIFFTMVNRDVLLGIRGVANA